MKDDSALAGAICDSLARLGSAVQGLVGPVQSYVETHPSRVLDLVVLLVFHPVGDRSREIAVLSVEAKGDRWTVDLVDLESSVVWEESLVRVQSPTGGREGSHTDPSDIDRLLDAHRATVVETVRRGLT